MLVILKQGEFNSNNYRVHSNNGAEIRCIQCAIKRDQCECFPPTRQVAPPHSEGRNASRRQHSKGLGDRGYMSWRSNSFQSFDDFTCTNSVGTLKFQCVIEENNKSDKHAVALVNAETIVPAEHSKIFKFFIRRGGSISAVVTGKREKGLGLVIPAVYLFTGDESDIKKLQVAPTCCVSVRL